MKNVCNQTTHRDWQLREKDDEQTKDDDENESMIDIAWRDSPRVEKQLVEITNQSTSSNVERRYHSQDADGTMVYLLPQTKDY
jgi:hypothetical protein